MLRNQVLSLLMILFLTACGGGGSNSQNSSIVTSSLATSSSIASEESSAQSSSVESSSDGSSSVSSINSTSSSSSEVSTSSNSNSFESVSSSSSSEQVVSSSSTSVSSDHSSSAQEGSASSSLSSSGATLSLSVTPKAIKLFTFTWNAIKGATEYRLYEKTDQGLGYSQVASIESTLTEFELQVFLPEKINASYLLQSCNANQCVDSNVVNISGNLAQAIGYFKASNPGLGDGFGRSLALSGDGATLAVGAPFEDSDSMGINGNQDNNLSGNSGAVYVFSLRNKVWVQEAYIKASNNQYWSFFGYGLDLSEDGNTLAIGSPLNDAGHSGTNGNEFDTTLPNCGAVYIFRRTRGIWSEEAYLEASNPNALDEFGANVALSGDGNSLSVFAKRESSNAAGLNGDQTNNSLVGSGAVYIFTKTEEEWSQQAYIKSLHPGVNEFFGYGLAMSFSGDTLAVGSQEYWDIVKGFRKAVQIFSRNGDIWSQQAYLQPTRYQSRAGLSLAISQDGNILAVGDSSDHHIEASSGAVYIFARDANSWSQQAFIKASEPSFYGEFGYTIDLSGDGNKLIVGARGESSDAVGVNGDQYNHMAVGSGAAYLFTRSNDEWIQSAYLKSPETRESLNFGDRVAISTNGGTVVIGSFKEPNNSVGINGVILDASLPDSGAVYLY